MGIRGMGGDFPYLGVITSNGCYLLMPIKSSIKAGDEMSRDIEAAAAFKPELAQLVTGKSTKVKERIANKCSG